jgi:aminopeptidase-like protein
LIGGPAVTLSDLRSRLDLEDLGRQMHACVADLYPLCRSITGDGLRETLRRLGCHLPLTLHEVPTGTPVLDWTVPREWNIRDAWVKNASGERVIDFQQSNLHVVNYSVPVRARMGLAELKAHLHTLPEHPDWVPYRTSYYRESWGFCVSQRQLEALPDGDYEVCIDSTLEPGHLTYGECSLPGETPDEVLISCHVCHPSLANDNLAGATVAAFLAKHLNGLPLRYSYRFLFIPGTIGSITWLARHEASVGRIKHGLVLACLGDAGAVTYKQSRQGKAVVDRAVAHVLQGQRRERRIKPFSPYGYDERQYCSPGFDLPVGCLMRTPHGQYAEYHTSADDLRLVQPAALADSLAFCLAVLDVLEGDRRYLNQNPKGEPQLGKRGLYRSMGGLRDAGFDEMALLWTLNLSDGGHTLLDIAERSGYAFDAIRRAADLLVEHGLLKEVTEAPLGLTRAGEAR